MHSLIWGYEGQPIWRARLDWRLVIKVGYPSNAKDCKNGIRSAYLMFASHARYSKYCSSVLIGLAPKQSRRISVDMICQLHYLVFVCWLIEVIKRHQILHITFNDFTETLAFLDFLNLGNWICMNGFSLQKKLELSFEMFRWKQEVL